MKSNEKILREKFIPFVCSEEYFNHCLERRGEFKSNVSQALEAMEDIQSYQPTIKKTLNEDKYKAMTEQLRLANSDEEVGNYIRWIIKSETAKEYWIEAIKQELLKQLMPVIYKNGYPAEAVPKTTILSLPALMKE